MLCPAPQASMFTPPDVRGELTALASDLLPDMEFYFVLASDEPPKQHMASGASGFTGPTLDVALRPWLTDRGLWLGRRPAVVLDDVHLWGRALTDWDGNRENADALYRNLMSSVVVHEIAHVASHGVDLSDPTPAFEQLAAVVNTDRYAAFCEKDKPPFLGHNIRWIRSALHLHYRARHRGHSTELPVVCDTGRYSLSGCYVYWHAILPECKRLARLPISQVLKIKPEKRLLKLWRDDLIKWRAQQTPTN